MTQLKGHRESWLVWLIAVILAVATLACYWPVRRYDFVNLDDGIYVSKAPLVQKGLSWPGIKWAFSTFDGGNWNPLVWISHMVDCQIYALNAGGHHVTNVLLHVANVIVLFCLLRRLTGALWRSAFVASVFAWHPMHVESVAWIAERKDVLSTLFLFLTIWAYAAFARTGPAVRKRWYLVSLSLFILGLMCKPMLVTLAAILLLLDYWPLRRQEAMGTLLIEKIPFAALSMAVSVLALCAQKSVGAIPPIPVGLRLENVLVSYAKYIGLLFWPTNLAVFYPFPKSIPWWQTGLAAILLSIVSWLVVRAAGNRRYLAVGWLWFVVTLLPVIGLIQVGLQALADRYTYIPYIGLAMMLAWGVAELANAWPRFRMRLVALCASGLAFCLAATVSQVEYWENSTALYEHALKATAGNYVAHNNLGKQLMDEQKYDDAIQQYIAVVELMPDVASPYDSLGTVYASKTNIEEAIKMFSKAISLDPNLEQAHYNLGRALMLKGQSDAAIAEWKTAARLKPDDAESQRSLGDAYRKSNKPAEAIPYFEKVTKMEPEDAHAYFDLGFAHQSNKQPELALANYKEALRLAPENPQCLNALAWLYATSPKPEIRNGAEAVRLASHACQITKRKNNEILDTLAAAYAEAGQFDNAIKTIGEIRIQAEVGHDASATNMAQQRMALYKAGRPFRDEQ